MDLFYALRHHGRRILGPLRAGDRPLEARASILGLHRSTTAHEYTTKLCRLHQRGNDLEIVLQRGSVMQAEAPEKKLTVIRVKDVLKFLCAGQILGLIDPLKPRMRNRCTTVLQCGSVLHGMRICFINVLYSHQDERGGLGSHIADLSVELVRSGHQVTVITSGKEGPYRERHVTIIPMGSVAKYSSPWQLLNPRYLLQRLFYMVRMTRHVFRAHYDIVEAADGGFEHIVLVLLRRCPTVTKLHGNFRSIYSSKGLLPKLIERLEAFAVRRSHGIYTSSQAYAQTIAYDYNIPLERIKVISQGIDISGIRNFSKIDLQQRYVAVKNKKLVFLSVGCSAERKGASVFVEAATMLLNKDFLFVLSCSNTDFLNGAPVPANLLVLPILDRNEFYNWISESDIVVFPSYFESFSIAVREAMLLNKMIVVSPYIPLEGIDREYHRYSVLQEIAALPLANAIAETIDGHKPCPEAEHTFHRQLIDKYDIRRVAKVTVEFYKMVALQSGGNECRSSYRV